MISTGTISPETFCSETIFPGTFFPGILFRGPFFQGTIFFRGPFFGDHFFGDRFPGDLFPRTLRTTYTIFHNLSFENSAWSYLYCEANVTALNPRLNQHAGWNQHVILTILTWKSRFFSTITKLLLWGSKNFEIFMLGHSKWCEKSRYVGLKKFRMRVRVCQCSVIGTVMSIDCSEFGEKIVYTF